LYQPHCFLCDAQLSIRCSQRRYRGVAELERSANAGFFKTLVNIWQPDPKEPEPVWQRSDYVAMIVVGILLVLLIGFWPA
jgi:hypothetical protein